MVSDRSNDEKQHAAGGDDYDTVDAGLTIGGTICEVTSAALENCDNQEVTIKLTEDGFREFITELRLQEYDAEASKWLSEHSTTDFAPLDSGQHE